MSARLVRYLLAAVLAVTASGCFARADDRGGRACADLAGLANGAADASAALQACFDIVDDGGELALRPGRYLLRRPVKLVRPLTLRTAGVQTSAPACGLGDSRCAVLVFRMVPGAEGGPLPFEIAADSVTLDHLVFEGSRLAEPEIARAMCLSKSERALAGGVGARGNYLRVTASVFRDFACYTAFEFRAGKAATIENNLFARNGTHDVEQMWSDGLTVHGGERLTIRGNRFVDNTDIQLIFGGCAACSVTGNRFRHGKAAAGGAFAELMIHAWPDNATTGRFDGSRFAGNDIDCGPVPRCGFGIMIGAAPWYDAPTRGGEVTGNRVRGAMLGINIDGLTGPMTIAGNDIEAKPGRYPSGCGPREVATGVNIAPASRQHVVGAPARASAVSWRGCILNLKR